MTATAHALVGGAIAATIPNPALGVTLALFSHPILDMIPHWDFGWDWRKKTKLLLFTQSVVDLGLGIILSYFIFYPFVQNLQYFLLCILAAEILDIITMPYLLLKWRFHPFDWLYNFQHSIQGKAKLPWGILNQVAAVIFIFILLQKIH